MRTFLAVILILVVLLLACTTETAPPPPQATNDAAPQAVATTVPATKPTAEMPTAAATQPPPSPTSTPEPTPTATSEPISTPEPAPTATSPAPTATTPPTATPTAVPPTPAPTALPARPTATATTTSSSTTLHVTVSAIPSNLPTYDRDDWKHWVDANGDCQDARQEVLVAESRTAATFRTDRKCKVATGEWLAPYSSVVVTDPSKLDVDHMVPLGNAHLSGAWAWSAQQRERYANHLADPQHLIAVTANANRSKGARGPEAWKPEDQSYWCQYAVDWIAIKDTWGLTATQAEHGALVVMLDTCANPPQLTVSQSQQVNPTPVPTERPAQPSPTPTPQTRTYANCDAAQAAGEHRIQGSKGGGKGFPKWIVPSARDGDGDGVVCEQ